MLEVLRQRIAFKLCVAPVVITLFIIGMGSVSQYGQFRQSAALDQMLNLAQPKTKAVVEIAQSAAKAHIDLFRAITWQVNSTDKNQVSESIQSVRANLAQAKRILKDLPLRFALSIDERAETDKLQVALNEYANSAGGVLDMVSADAATAVSFLLPAEDRYHILEQHIAELDRLEQQGSEQMAGSAIQVAAGITRLSLALLLGALVLAVLVTSVVSRAIARPIVAMTQSMTALASDNKNIEIPATHRLDEIGQMAKAVLVFKENMLRNDALLTEQEHERMAKEARARRLEAKARGFDASVTSVVNAVSAATTELETSAQMMSSTADRTRDQATTVATASGRAFVHVESVAAATEELSASIIEIGRQVTKANAIAGQAMAEAKRTRETSQLLLTATGQIGKVLAIIHEIAARTNLLALNATIEAARAGEAGKGFAIVATEVKSLASQTSQATEDIRRQVDAMHAATRESVDAVEAIHSTIQEINEVATSIAAAIDQQGASTSEIVRNVQQAASGTLQVSTNITSVTSATGETGQAANHVLVATQILASQTAELRLQVEEFLSEVRRA